MTSRSLRKFSPLLVVGLLVVSCSSDDDSSGQTTVPAASTTAAPGSTSPGTTSPGTPGSTAPATTEAVIDHDDDAILRWGFSVGPVTLDPHKVTGITNHLYYYPVYDRLIRMDENNIPQPMLATEWELDGKKFTLKLREGVTFQDGEPFNADAVKANFDRMFAIENSPSAADLKMVESVEVVDDYTIVLNITGSGGVIPTFLSDRAGSMISPKAFDNADLDVNPVGAGPFKVISNDPGSLVRMERWDGYWDRDAIKIAGIDFIVQSDDRARTNALLSGQIDATNLREPAVKEVEDNDGTSAVVGPYGLYYGMKVNPEKSEFANPLVREALGHAIDRDAIAETLFDGLCTPEVQPWADGYYPYNPEYTSDKYGYDPDLARKQLAEAGLPNGFTFEAVVPTLTIQQDLAVVLQAQFAEVGITMNITTVENPQQRNLFNAGDFDAMVNPAAGRIEPSLVVYDEWMPGGALNPTDFTSDKIQSLYNEALESDDPAVRGPLYQQIFDEVWKLGNTTTVVCMRNKLIGHADYVFGIKAFQSGIYDFRDVYIKKD